jgi:hypothetical protein
MRRVKVPTEKQHNCHLFAVTLSHRLATFAYKFIGHEVVNSLSSHLRQGSINFDEQRDRQN